MERSCRWRRAALLLAAAAAGWAGMSTGTQDAAANGDTRTLTILHMHTKESATVTFRRGGRYDPEALNQLNWLLRDWRIDEPVKMDPRLFDIVWEVHRSVGSSEPVHVVSAYRSPGTNAALRRRSRLVAEHSQHMLGKAMDFYLPDVPPERLRVVAMRMQNGGVGFYPTANTPFVHLDAGSVRHWPRMTRDQLARLFPDGRTVHLPRDGKPLDGYEEARATILARGGSVLGSAAMVAEAEAPTRRRSLWATLFGGDEDEDAEFIRTADRRGGGGLFRRSPQPPPVALASSGNGDDAGQRLAYAPEPARAPPPVQAPVQVAALPEAPAAAPGAAPLDLHAGGGRGDMPALMPMPPRRPSEMAGPTGSAFPMPPSRPTELAARTAPASEEPAPAATATGQPRVRPGQRDRARLQALFAMAAAPSGPAPDARVTTARARPRGDAPAGLVGDGGAGLALSFTPVPNADLGSARFAGPAVRPLGPRP